MIKDKVVIFVLMTSDDIEDMSAIDFVNSIDYDNKEVVAVDMTKSMLKYLSVEEHGTQAILAPNVSDEKEKELIVYNYLRKLFLLGDAEWLLIISDKLIFDNKHMLKTFLKNRKFVQSGIYQEDEEYTNVKVPKRAWAEPDFLFDYRQLEVKEIPPSRFRIITSTFDICFIHRYVLSKVKFRKAEVTEPKDVFHLFCNDARVLKWHVWCEPEARGELKNGRF